MEKVKLDVHYALMLEMMKAKGFSNPTIVALLSVGNEDLLESIGEGMTSWKTLINYYHSNRALFHQAMREGYEMETLTKEALKSLLSIKFDLQEGEGFLDTGDGLDNMIVSSFELEELREILSSNWTLVIQEENQDEDTYIVKVKYAQEPVLKV